MFKCIAPVLLNCTSDFGICKREADNHLYPDMEGFLESKKCPDKVVV